MKKIILIHVFSFIAISAMCQKMESGNSTIDGRPAAPKAATVQTGKAYAGYVAPAAEKKQVTTQQTAKPVEKPIVLPTGGNVGNVPAEQANKNTEAAPVKVQGTSIEVKSIKPVAENKQISSGPSSTDAVPAALAPKAEAKAKTGGQ